MNAGDGGNNTTAHSLRYRCETAITPRAISSKRILLVDDCADATEALGTLLELEAHEVKRATSGAYALSIVETFAPDVALIDISMPGMNGPELAQLLRLRVQCSLTKNCAKKRDSHRH